MAFFGVKRGIEENTNGRRETHAATEDRRDVR
jgi:hypothetical protein